MATKTLKPTNVTISIPEFTDQPDQRVNSNCIDKEADAINALSEQMGNAFEFTQLFGGVLNTVDGEVTLIEDGTHFQFLLLGFMTNSEHKFMLVPNTCVTNKEYIEEQIVGHNANGQVTWPPAYNSSIIIQFISNTKIKCTQSIYNNVNYKVALRTVHGFMRISS